MSMKVVLHLPGEEPILAEINEMPGANDQSVTVRNMRKRDGKPLAYLTTGATSFIFPLARLTFIEVLDEAESAEENTSVIAFFREDVLPRRR